MRTKKTLKLENEQLKHHIEILTRNKNLLLNTNHELSETLEQYKATFPFMLNDTVYELELRSAKGRFTKTKPSIDQSKIVEHVVDTKNYFNLVKKYEEKLLFKTLEGAEDTLREVCEISVKF